MSGLEVLFLPKDGGLGVRFGSRVMESSFRPRILGPGFGTAEGPKSRWPCAKMQPGQERSGVNLHEAYLLGPVFRAPSCKCSEPMEWVAGISPTLHQRLHCFNSTNVQPEMRPEATAVVDIGAPHNRQPAETLLLSSLQWPAISPLSSAFLEAARGRHLSAAQAGAGDHCAAS